MARTVFIIAAESSGDLHGANLARALREREPDIVLGGLGGSKMAEAGVEVFRDVTTHAAIGFVVSGLSEAWAQSRLDPPATT